MRIETLEKNPCVSFGRKLRVAAYVRVSAEKSSALDSLENQTETYTEKITANPDWELAGVYEDRGISGTKEMRPEFQRMLSDCRTGKIDLILTKSFTRFARNTVVLLSTLRELKKLNIEVIFEKDNIRSLSESGELLITLLAAFAQAESQSASENQRWRIQKMFEEGRPNTGTMLGYRLKDGKLVIVPEEVEIVRMIFSDYLSGMGICAIAKKLNRMNVAAFNGGQWCKNSVRSILTNEKYAGNLLLQKTYSRDYLDRKKRVNHGERTMYFVENSHEAIVPAEMFEAVLAAMKSRAEKAMPKRVKSTAARYPFTGLIVCEMCGAHYRRKIANAGSKYEKAVWICSTYNTLGKEFCGNGQQLPEHILTAKTVEVLGTDKIDEAIPEQLAEIQVPEAGRLVYVFRDGTTKDVRWKHSSRRESWTEEMRQKAREKALKRHKGGKSNG